MGAPALMWGIEGWIPIIFGFLASSLIGSLSLDMASSHSMWHDARLASVLEKRYDLKEYDGQFFELFEGCLIQ